MALSVTKLENEIRPVWEDNGASPGEFATNLMAAYFNYASDAEADNTDPVFTNLEDEVSALIVLASILSYHPTPTEFVTALVTAIISFWQLPPVTFRNQNDVGAVTAITGTPASIVILNAFFVVNSRTTEEVITEFAKELDRLTRTVQVTVTRQGGGVDVVTLD